MLKLVKRFLDRPTAGAPVTSPHPDARQKDRVSDGIAEPKPGGDAMGAELKDRSKDAYARHRRAGTQHCVLPDRQSLQPAFHSHEYGISGLVLQPASFPSDGFCQVAA
jgi:hypothetical protein